MMSHVGPKLRSPASGHGQTLLFVAAAIALAVLPIFTSGYQQFQLGQFLVLLIAVHALNLLAGVGGQISLGNGAFYAVGAYAYAIAFQTFGIGHGFALLIAMMAAGLAGLVIGTAGMRLQGTHLALATFAVAVAMPQFLRFSGMEPLTGGPGGILIDMPSPPFGLEIASDLYLFFLVSAVALAVLWVGENMARGRLGRMLIAARDNPVAAASTGGLDVGPLRVKLFVVTAAMTGIAGGLNAMLTLFVSPDGFTLFLSISLLVGIVIGGLGSLLGSIIGTLFVFFVPDLVGRVSHSATGVMFGAVIVACMFFAPNGAVGLLRAARDFIKKNLRITWPIRKKLTRIHANEG